MSRVAIGLLIGLVASFGLTNALSSQLYGVGGGDPLTLMGSVLVFGIVGLAACYVPGRRAARVDPMTALRCE
jgi:ABC-type antimicrobial peptide transport system permease subunit